MLSREHNDLLTRTGSGAPMGELIRRYWIPALLSEEIPEPDAPPAQVRLLGEELVAFRDSEGRIGLLDEHCLHRGASLFYGRNEQCGLRCIYHGWKYDVEGNVVDTPAEPAASDYKHKLKQKAYPTVEVAGIVFAYLGPWEQIPLFPNYEWTQIPSSQTYVTKCLLECNYLQGLEGECDSSHLSFLHRDLRVNDVVRNTPPDYETEDTDFGVRMVAIRNAGPDKQYVRVSSFVMPFLGCIPAGIKAREGYEVHIYVPANDKETWRYDFGFRRNRPVREEEVHRRKQIGADYRRIRNQRNHYLQDRRIQRTDDFTGIEDFLNEDACATESMGAIFDRTREHLGASDKAVIALRKFLINAVHEVQSGKEPPHIIRDPAKNHFPHIDVIAETIPSSIHWRQYFPHLTDPTSRAR